MMPNEQKHDAFPFQKSEDDSVMNIHSERPHIEPLRMEFLYSQGWVKRVFSEEVGLLGGLSLDSDVKVTEQLVKGLRCENSHLLGEEISEGLSSRDSPLMQIAFRSGQELEKRTLEKAGRAAEGLEVLLPDSEVDVAPFLAQRFCLESGHSLRPPT